MHGRISIWKGKFSPGVVHTGFYSDAVACRTKSSGPGSIPGRVKCDLNFSHCLFSIFPSLGASGRWFFVLFQFMCSVIFLN